MSQLGWAGWLAAFMLLMFLISNGLHTRGLPFYTTRKLVHFGAAVPLLVSPLVFQDVIYPVALALAFLGLLASTHNWDFFPGCARKGRWSELWFPFSVAGSIAVLWSVGPWLAMVPGLLLSLADGGTGIVRKMVYQREVKGNWGSVACFAIALAVAVPIIQPHWLGIPVALAATVAERYCGDAPGSKLKVDDNLALPSAALAVMVVGLYATNRL